MVFHAADCMQLTATCSLLIVKEKANIKQGKTKKGNAIITRYKSNNYLHNLKDKSTRKIFGENKC